MAVPTPFVAWNYLCQGGVGELLKRAIVTVSETYHSKGMRSRVALDMHDALILEVAHDEWDAEADLDDNQHKWGGDQWHPPREL